ncbi:unnamed protein product [Phytophthora fragariaefolia]|uniref:Unnamed protein product n=1 Tax=Phytophthora fragariaefolia TaxID=1490495 RepID=A0A9W7D5D8_9STRA|nr:unnamed protein product [Phytophthora fragariaefolia]
MVKMFHFTFNTDFFHNYSNLYRLPKVEVDEATGNQRYPDNFQVVCHVEMLDSNGNPFPPKSGSSSSILQSGSSSSIRDDEVEQARTIRPHSAPQQRRMTVPSHQPYYDKAQPQGSWRPEEATPTMQGWLYKQGGFVKNWKKRWFVAREGKMMYYHGMSDATPLGVVNLRRVTVEICESHEVNARNKCLHFFKVVPPSAGQRTYFFGAETEQDLVGWIRVLGAQSAYGIVNGGLSRRPSMTRNNTFATRSSYQQEYQTRNRVPERIRPSSDGSRSYHVNDTRASLPSMTASAPASAFSTLHDAHPSLQLNETELAFRLPSEDSTRPEPSEAAPFSSNSSGRRESMPSDVTGAAQRALELRSLSFTDYDEGEGDRLSSTSAISQCIPAEPVADLTNTLSAREQESLLQEVNGFETGIYIYSADELLEAAQLQKYMRETRGESTRTGDDPDPDPDPALSAAYGLKDSPPGTLSRQLHQYMVQKRLDEAEQLLTELVLTKFPSLIDAMDHDPLAFTQLIAGGDISLASHRLHEQEDMGPSVRQDSNGHRRAVFF